MTTSFDWYWEDAGSRERRKLLMVLVGEVAMEGREGAAVALTPSVSDVEE